MSLLEHVRCIIGLIARRPVGGLIDDAPVPALNSITVAPDTDSVDAGTTQQFTATGHYSDGAPDADITATVTWDTSNHSVATIDAAGLLTGVGEGTCTVSATLGGASDSSGTITVVAILTSITVAPDTATVNAAATQQFTATGHYTGKADTVITTSVTWDTSDHAKATIGAATGLLTGVAEGTCTVTATLGLVSDSSGTITIAAVLTSITVTPANPTFRPTASTDRQAFVATGHYTGKADTVITTSVVWASATPATATISNAGGTEGQAAAVAGAITGPGEATSVITATVGAIVGNTTLTVDTDIDATKLWRTPANDYQWTILGETTPTDWWDCQDASGNLVGKRGARTLVATGSPLYHQTDAAWSAFAVSADDGVAEGFTIAAAGAPDASTTSQLWMVFAKMPATPAALRSICGVLVPATGSSTRHNTAGRLNNVTVGTSINGSTTIISSTDQCIAGQHDRTNNKSNSYNLGEKVTGTHADVVTDSAKGILGVTGAGASAAKIFRAWLWEGAAGEITTGAVNLRMAKLTKTTIGAWS